MFLQSILSQLALSGSPAPGKLVDVGGHQMYLLCEGEGSPTVVLESGMPGSSLGWASVTEAIGRFSRVCSYDRAGYARSEASSRPRTLGNIAEELALLLRNARIDPPYVLVGHSFGGLVTQLYAARFPAQVSGMVLVDSSHPDQSRRTADLARMRSLAFRLRLLAPIGLARLLLDVPAGNPESRDRSVRKAEGELLMTTRSLRTLTLEMAGLGDSLGEATRERPRLGRKPLVVLTQGRHRPQSWDDWYGMQEDLAALSDSSDWQITDAAGHFIHQDQPELVVDAIRRVVESSRSAAGGVP